MSRFPSKEVEVFALAQEMMTGLAANAAIYPLTAYKRRMRRRR